MPSSRGAKAARHLGLLAVAAVVGLSPGASAKEILLSLSNPAEIETARWPVTIGVPFAVGELSEANVSLVDSEGLPVPAQTDVLSRWWARDNSVSVLLVTFLADTAAESYRLVYPALQTPVAPAEPVAVEQEDGTVTVTTGPLRAVLSSRTAGLFEQVFVDANGDGRFSEDELLSGAGGATLFAGGFSTRHSPAQLTVEEQGPVRAVVKAEGRCVDERAEGALAYLARLTFHAGCPFVSVDLTFILEGDEIFSAVPSLGWHAPLSLEGKVKASLLLDQDDSAPLEVDDAAGLSLLQLGPEAKEQVKGLDNPFFIKQLETRKRWWSDKERALWERDERQKKFAYTLRQGGKTLRSGGKADCILQLSSADSPFAVTCSMRWFWQLHPKAVTVKEGGITFGLWPEKGVEPLRLHHGTAKTHSFLFSFQRKDRAAEGIAACRAFLQPPEYFPSPEQFCDSGVWGRMFALRKGKFTFFEENAKSLVSNYLGARKAPDRGGYGMLNFGDQPWGGSQYGNLETAYGHALFAQFARTGDRPTFDCFVEAVNHSRDVDVRHADAPGYDYGMWLMPGYMPEAFCKLCAEDDDLRKATFYYQGEQPPKRGGVYRHSYRHHGNAQFTPYPEGIPNRPAGAHYSGTCGVGGHGWCVGLVDHYLLTGDRRSLEVAEEVGNWVLEHGGTGTGRDNWKYIDLVALYQATGRKAYRDRIEEAIDYVYEHREQIVGTDQSKSLMSPFYTILKFIRDYHVITGDAEVRRKFLKMIDLWIGSQKSMPSGRGAVFPYIRHYLDSRCHGDFADLAYAHQLTGDRSYVERSLASFTLYMQTAYHSTFAYEAPWYLNALDRLGLEALDDPRPTANGTTAYWLDENDTPITIHVYQNFGYRADVKEAAGAIEVRSPAGKVAKLIPLTLGGLDYYRISLPPDGETGRYALRVTDPPANCHYAFASDPPGISASAPPQLAEGRWGKGLLLQALARAFYPTAGNLRREEGTIELWFKPSWISPAARNAEVPYHYNVLFDSRDREYDYGFHLYFYDSGKPGAVKSLNALWADRDKADNFTVAVRWDRPAWHHLAFAWRLEGATARGALYVDGKPVASGEKSAANFPTRLHDTLTLGANSPGNQNTSLGGVLDGLRISSTMKSAFDLTRPPDIEADTLLLANFEEGATPDFATGGD